jgi:hypothetical protein
VQRLGLVGRHVDTGGTVRHASLAGQAQVQRFQHLRRGQAADRTEDTAVPAHGYVSAANYRVCFTDVVENIAAFRAGGPIRVL